MLGYGTISALLPGLPVGRHRVSAPFYRAVWFAVLASLLIWLCACKGELTEIVVVVDSDLVVPQELDRVTIQVDGLGDQPDVTTHLRERPLPIWLGLVNQGDALGPITVRVIGALGTEARVMAERTAVRFQRGKTLTLRIELLRACTTDASACTQVCDNAECLTAWNGPPPKLDASIPDTGMGIPDAGEDAADEDSGVIDAGDAGDADASDASDAMVDAGPLCVIDAGTCFDYTPSNFDPLAVLDTASANGALTVDCPGAEFDSTALAFTGWCGDDAPAVVEVVQADGIAAVVIPATSLTITGGGSLRLVGNRPVIFAVFGDAEINGSLDASAVGAIPGAGGNAACTVGTGAAGQNQTASDRGGSGGGGGAFGSVGGTGGRGDRGAATATATGMLEGNASIVPLRGGCAGGRGGMGTTTDDGNVGGGGGGAIQVSAAGMLSIGGVIAAGGGGGQRGMRDEDGGGGGGSGGAVLLECEQADFAVGAWVNANGGGGGGASDYDSSASQPGLDAPAAGLFGGSGGAGDNRGGDGGNGAGRSTAASSGQNGRVSSVLVDWYPGAGGGGGGGGLGRIRVRDNTRAVSACTLSGNFSPVPSIECGG